METLKAIVEKFENHQWETENLKVIQEIRHIRPKSHGCMAWPITSVHIAHFRVSKDDRIKT